MRPVRTSTEAVRTSGLSRRAYAEARGLSESGIRKHIRSGLLKPALLPDGMLDPERADALLAANVTRSPAPTTPELVAARNRKLAVQCRLLRDEVAATRAGVLPAAEVDRKIADSARRIASALRPILAAGGHVAGKPPGVAAEELGRAIHGALTAICAAADSEAQDPGGGPDADTPLEELDATALAAVKADLEAERLELAREIERGDVVRYAPAVGEFVQRLQNLRQSLLAIPSRSAARLAGLKPEPARALVRELLIEAVGKMQGRGVALADVIAAIDEP